MLTVVPDKDQSNNDDGRSLLDEIVRDGGARIGFAGQSFDDSGEIRIYDHVQWEPALNACEITPIVGRDRKLTDGTRRNTVSER